MRHSLTVLILGIATLCCDGAVAVDVPTSRNDLGRTGVNAEESTLTPANVNARDFGKLWTLYADGQVVAQPLHVADLGVDTRARTDAPLVQGRFNAVVVATMHNTVYLYDADREQPGPMGRNVPLWATWLGQPRPSGKDIDMWSTNDPEWGILSTPVIDTRKAAVYIVAWHDTGGGPDGYRYRLHALRLKDGTHVAPPVELQAPGLNARLQKQRAGLALVDGTLYIAFGGDGSRGLLLAHDAASLTRRAAWQVTPSGRDGGLWQAGVAPAADAQGHVYLMTGNGTFDAGSGGSNYGSSFVKLRLEGDRLVVKDYFTPCNQEFLTRDDWDLGSSGPVLIPGTDLVFGAGKWPRLFLLSITNLGKYSAPPTPGVANCPNPTALQELGGSGTNDHLHGSPVFWEGTNGAQVYLWREHQLLHAYPFVGQRLVDNPKLGVDGLPEGMPGGMLSLSSRGKTNGILWAVTPLDGDANTSRGVRGVLRAIDAEDVTRTLWSSEQVSARDRLGLFAKYAPPTIANGKVFVATYGDAEALHRYGGDERPRQFPARYQVAVYGLLPPGPISIVDQSRDDVQLVRATTSALPRLDLARCASADGASLDCTAELQRASGAPAFERLLVPAGYGFTGCQLARVTGASKAGAMPSALAIGFYAADVTAGQVSADHGRRSLAVDLKEAGTATLKSGEAATLHEFAGIVNCTLGAGTRSQLRLKPYMEFEGPPPRTIYRNWDPAPGNLLLGADVAQIDRRAEILQ